MPDIHIEPEDEAVTVRYRIDGVLYEVMKPPMKLRNAITSRMKIMSELDIAERRIPQDGRFRVRFAMDIGEVISAATDYHRAAGISFDKLDQLLSSPRDDKIHFL